EAGRVFQALHAGLSVPEVRDRVLGGKLLTQRSRSTRERIWDSLHHRYLAHRVGWVIRDLAGASIAGPQSREFLSLLYLHYALRGRLTYEFATRVLWPRWCRGQLAVAREDVLDLLDRASAEQPQIRRWTEKSRVKLAGSILSALRDFGLFRGIQKKSLVRPVL